MERNSRKLLVRSKGRDTEAMIKRLNSRDTKLLVRLMGIRAGYRDRGFLNRYTSLQTRIEL